MTAIPRDEALHALALASLPGVGPVAIRRLMASHADVRAALQAAAGDDGRVAEALAAAARLRERCERRSIDVLAPGDGRYPAPLLDLEDPPAVLYALGDTTVADRPAVALVGARRATGYGRLVVREFARRLADAGVCVVSGLAMGIDAEAHAAALDASGATIAVQGTGVDVPYPRANSALHARVARDGLVLSELPPGRSAHPGAFPRRNRLIAALADVVVVVEAGVRSGALITAQVGGTLGRLVAAVPGAIDSDASTGANQLLRDGAHVIASFDDLLALVALTRRGTGLGERAGFAPIASSIPRDPLPGADTAEGRILAVLAFGPQGPDDLVRACGISPREVGSALATLSLLGQVVVDPAGMARRRGGVLDAVR